MPSQDLALLELQSALDTLLRKHKQLETEQTLSKDKSNLSADPEFSRLQKELDVCRNSQEEIECTQLKKELEELQRISYKKQMKFAQQRNSASRPLSSYLHSSAINGNCPDASHSISSTSGLLINQRDSSVRGGLNSGNNSATIVSDEWLGGDESDADWEWALDANDLACWELGCYSDEELDTDSLDHVTSVQAPGGSKSDRTNSPIPMKNTSDEAMSSTLAKTLLMSGIQSSGMTSTHREWPSSSCQMAGEQNKESSIARPRIDPALPFELLELPGSFRKRPGQSIYKQPGQHHPSANGQGLPRSAKRVRFHY